MTDEYDLSQSAENPYLSQLEEVATAQERKVSDVQVNSPRLQSIAYSLDALVPGFYLWCGALKIRIGGSLPEESYSGTIHNFAGVALVLPGYRIYSTYQDSYDPR